MTKRKKILIVVVVVAMLLPLLEGLFSISSLWRTSANEPAPTELINTDFLKVSYTSQNDTEKGTTSWLINYDYDMSKSTTNDVNGTYEKGKLKLKLTNGEIVSAADPNLQLPETQFQAGSVEKGSWIEAKSFTDNGKGSFKYTTAIGSEPTLALQFDGENPVVIDSISTVATSETSEEETVPSSTEEFEVVENILVGKSAETFTLKGPAVENPAEKTQTETKKANTTKQATQSRNTRAGTTVGKDLIISQDAVVEKVHVISKAATSGKSDYQPTIKHKNNLNSKHTEDYNSAAAALSDNTYELFTAGAAGTAIVYNKSANGTNPYYTAMNESTKSNKTATMQFKNNADEMENEEITLIYDHVGGYIGADGLTPKKVGAVIHLTNIVIGPSATWTVADGNPWMEFSHNLFSGVIYGNIHKFDIEFNFFDAEKHPDASATNMPSEFIDFSEGSAATMTFASLNGYGNTNLYFQGKAPKAHEFAGRIDGGLAGNVGSTLKFYQNGSCDYDKQSYYSKSDVNGGENSFTDYLGGATFATAAVTFPMEGTAHKYKFGSTQGRAWNTFASSSLAQVNQNPPTKTVQPLKQYQKGDSWNSPTGGASEFEQRYYNDLDRYNDGNDPWSLPEKYRVKGHDADKESELSEGVPHKASRYVETGQEHYYFINQETIDVSSKSLIVPKQYIFEDTLPKGVELSDSNWKDSLTLYNINGKTKFETKEIINWNPVYTEVKKLFEDDSTYDRSSGKLTLILTEAASRAINEQSGEDGFYGKDFSLRLKVKVTNTVDDKINDLMENKAKVTFVYGTKEGQKPAFETNLVHTKVHDNKTAIEFEKIDGQGNLLSGVEFKLYKENSTDVIASATSVDGKVKFDKLVAPGNYVIKETKILEGYKPIGDLKVTVDQNLNVTIKDGANNAITDNKVKNHLYPFRLELQKTDGFGSTLDGVTFTLTKDNKTYTTKSKDGGKITFAEDLEPGTYTLTETETLDGYSRAANTWEIVISAKDKSATINGEKLTVTYNDGKKHWLITPDGEIGKIENKIKAFELSILKIDEVTKNALSNATFELFAKEDNKFETPLAEATTDGSGKSVFKKNDNVYELAAGKTYLVKEKTAPDGYLLLEHPFEVEISEKGVVTITYNGKAIAKEDFKYELTKGDTNNNTIELKAKNTPEGSLPTTGGQGIKKFMTLSLVVLAIVGGLGAFYVYRNKKGGA